MAFLDEKIKYITKEKREDLDFIVKRITHFEMLFLLFYSVFFLALSSNVNRFFEKGGYRYFYYFIDFIGIFHKPVWKRYDSDKRRNDIIRGGCYYVVEFT